MILPQVDYYISQYDVWIMRLCNEGYGDYNTIRNMEVDRFFKLVHYENFKADYKEAFRALNQKK